jgi:hypothetical protein
VPDAVREDVGSVRVTCDSETELSDFVTKVMVSVPDPVSDSVRDWLSDTDDDTDAVGLGEEVPIDDVLVAVTVPKETLSVGLRVWEVEGLRVAEAVTVLDAVPVWLGADREDVKEAAVMVSFRETEREFDVVRVQDGVPVLVPLAVADDVREAVDDAVADAECVIEAREAVAV